MDRKRTLLRGKFVIGYDGKRHVIYEDGELVYEGDTIIFAGHNYPGTWDECWDTGLSIISPGFIDLEADIDNDHANYDVVLFKKYSEDGPNWEQGKEPREKDPYSDEDFYIRQKYSMAQLIMNGITTAMPIAGERFHAWSQSSHEFEIMAQTAKEMGIRAYLGPSFKSRLGRYLQDDPIREAQSFKEAVAYCEKYNDTNAGLIRSFMNPCQIAITNPNILQDAMKEAEELKIPMRLHACEEDVEWKYMLPRYGKTTIDFFEELGLLNSRLLMPHAITVKDSELKKLAQYNVSVIHTPIAEINYGASLFSYAKYLEYGINMSIGTDAQPTDMIQNMRLAWDIDRLCEWRFFFTRYGEDNSMTDMFGHERHYKKTNATDFFNGATLNGARALDRQDIGVLAEGAKADIIVIDLDDLAVGPYEDPIRTMIISCVGNNVKHTIINGVTRMKDRKLIGIDEKKLKLDAQRVFERFLTLYGRYDANKRPLSELCPPSMPILKKPSAEER
jgi:5-methylthioadenosine/S-adenosylhomocysteine deaminase